ncbi:hypothetical protein [Pseudomonas sp. 31 E 6]|nr:hypothetical protein [Pseudomonas sp. 31 E 5]CRM73868.1 hypothetical protein [Pseudomonas sp. 31 E 6]
MPSIARAPCNPASRCAGERSAAPANQRSPPAPKRRKPPVACHREPPPPLHARRHVPAGGPRFRPVRYAGRGSSPGGRYARRIRSPHQRGNAPNRRCGTAAHRPRTGWRQNVRRSGLGAGGNPAPGRRPPGTARRSRPPAAAPGCCRGYMWPGWQSAGRSARCHGLRPCRSSGSRRWPLRSGRTGCTAPRSATWRRPAAGYPPPALHRCTRCA